MFNVHFFPNILYSNSNEKNIEVYLEMFGVLDQIYMRKRQPPAEALARRGIHNSCYVLSVTIQLSVICSRNNGAEVSEGNVPLIWERICL